MYQIIDFLKDIFIYKQNTPLLFTQFYFWAFFAIVLTIYCFIYKRIGLRNAYLFLVSLFFYYKTSGIYLILLIITVIVNYYFGKAIYMAPTPRKKKWILATSVIFSLSFLAYYKYSYLTVDTINVIFGTNFKAVDWVSFWINDFSNSHFDIDKIILPIGISFFTFHNISYTIDIYRKEVEPVKNIVDFGFYVAFFPHLVAGPILRASTFLPQLYKKFSLTREQFGIAVFLILNGLLKKMFISDFISINFVDRVFSNPMLYTGFENLMSLYGYSIQVYCDFSGYTDIATGVALLLGFQLPVNFNSPYKAQHVGEFWKRWHISLSTWLKDYLYIPLGGNKGSKFRTNINLMLTMLLGGLWHGASWQFVIWGGLNGIALVFYKYWKKISPFPKNDVWWVRFYSIFLTFNFITFTRIWFRAESMQTANQIIYQITHEFNFSQIFEVILAYKDIFGVILLAYIIHWLPVPAKQKYKNWFVSTPHWAKVAIIVLTVFIIFQVKTSDLQPFIYFQF